MLELKNICKTFNPGTINAKSALNDLSLTLADGDFVTVIGGNGAGSAAASSGASRRLNVRTTRSCCVPSTSVWRTA